MEIPASATTRTAIAVTVGGKLHAFTHDEALVVAAAAESAMNAYPDDPDSRCLPNLILALRQGAKQARNAEPPSP